MVEQPAASEAALPSLLAPPQPEMMAFPDGAYALILADPPWQFRSWSDNGRNRCPDAMVRQKGRHYKVMGIRDIASDERGRRDDDLHVPQSGGSKIVARRLGPPMLIGPGRAAFRWPAIARPEQALRFSMTAYPLGGDVLFDCALDNAPELAISV